MNGESACAAVIAQLSRIMNSRMNRALEKFDLTQSQAITLMYLRECEDAGADKIYQKDIEQALLLSNPAVSGILSRLEAKGLVERRTSMYDCRHKEIRTTESAKALESAMREYKLRQEEILMSGIAPEDREILKKCLEIMLRNCLSAEEISSP